VATFTDADPLGAASQFTAVITWGNGYVTMGQVSPNGGSGFKVTGTMTWTATGTYTVVVYITDVGGSTATATSTATVTQPQAPTRPGPRATGTRATATHGVLFRGNVAAFLGSIVGGTAASYTASIDWGNGTTSAGVIRPTGANQFNVFAGTTYAHAGTYTVKVTIQDSSGATTTVDTTLLVADARLAEPEPGPDLGGKEDASPAAVLVRFAVALLPAEVEQRDVPDEFLTSWEADAAARDAGSEEGPGILDAARWLEGPLGETQTLVSGQGLLATQPADQSDNPSATSSPAPARDVPEAPLDTESREDLWTSPLVWNEAFGGPDTVFLAEGDGRAECQGPDEEGMPADRPWLGWDDLLALPLAVVEAIFEQG
jgi:PKD repeat protein